MKKFLTIIFILVFATWSFGQDIPLLSQKINDGIWQFPSLTGWSGGSAFIDHRQSFNMGNASDVSMMGAHTLLKDERIGIGGNFYYETINIFRNINLAFLLSHHLPVSSKHYLSFGLSSEFFRTDINTAKLESVDLSDPLLMNYKPVNHIDFSPGFSLNHKNYICGITVNRTRQLLTNRSDNLFGGGVTIFSHLHFADQQNIHAFEPSIVYRYNNHLNTSVAESWLYYTYKEKYIAGMVITTMKRMSLNAAIKINKRWVAGYGYQFGVGQNSISVNGKTSHEIILRFNFNKQYYRQSIFNPELLPRKVVTHEKD